MAKQSQRLSKVAKEFNVGVDTILDFLASKGIDDLNRKSKISPDTYDILVEEYQPDKKVKAEAKELKKAVAEQKEQEKDEVETVRISAPIIEGLKIVSNVDVSDSKIKSNTNEEKEVKEKVTSNTIVDEQKMDVTHSDDKSAKTESKVDTTPSNKPVDEE